MSLSFLRKSRKKIDIELANSKLRRMISPIIFAQYKITIPITRRYISGKLIDVGCGFSPYRELLSDKITVYDGIDKKNITILLPILKIFKA